MPNSLIDGKVNAKTEKLIADTKEKIKVIRGNGLRFDEAPHEYTYNGMKLPSVTTLMQPLIEAEYAGIGDQTLRNAADRGTEVHFAIENHIKFGWDEIDPQFQGYFDGFLKWEETEKPIYLASELYVFHPLMLYAGTIDLLAIIDGKLALIDLKSTSKLMDKNVRVQLEGYSRALSALGINIESKYALLIKPDAKYIFMRYDTLDIEALEVFKGLKNLYNYINKK